MGCGQLGQFGLLAQPHADLKLKNVRGAALIQNRNMGGMNAVGMLWKLPTVALTFLIVQVLHQANKCISHFVSYSK